MRTAPSPLMQGLALLGFALAVAAAAGIGSAATTANIPTWYASLEKPGFTPPNWLFPVAWTALYAMIALAAWLVWRRRDRYFVRMPLTFWTLQLALNALWSVLFFGMQSPSFALVEVAFLWLAILVTILTFRSVSRPAAWLMMPYLLWVSYAAALNGAIWWLN